MTAQEQSDRNAAKAKSESNFHAQKAKSESQASFLKARLPAAQQAPEARPGVSAQHFAEIRSTPLRSATPTARARKVKIEQVEGLAAALRRAADPAANEGVPIVVLSSVSTLRTVAAHSTDTNPGTFPTVIKMVDGTKSITLDSTGIVMTDSSTGKSFTISFAALTQNVALRAEAYCDAAVNKTMLIPGSAPY